MLKITGDKKGFTLLEAIVAISIFTLILGFLTNFIVFSYQEYAYNAENAKAVDEARRGMELMVKEIREAKTADSGSYPIEIADDKQIVFYSDIDDDGKAEKVRYFLGTAISSNQIQECTAVSSGGTCSVNFSNLLSGNLKSAQVKISVDGDLDSSSEYVAVSADGTALDNRLCRYGCLHCLGNWQGATTTNVMAQAADGSITFLADASSNVSRECPPSGPNHAMKARFELSWSEEVIGLGNELKMGVIEPVGDPVEYPADQEKISTITSYVRNSPPIFKYYDLNGNEITEGAARLIETKLMKVYLVINIDPNRPPTEFQLESFVQLRNLKEE